jgi:hypothetical protein
VLEEEKQTVNNGKIKFFSFVFTGQNRKTFLEGEYVLPIPSPISVIGQSSNVIKE